MKRDLRSIVLSVCAASAVFISACDGGSADPAKLTDSGYAALGTRDWKGALGDFDKALATLKPADAGFLRAKMGRVETLIHSDAAKAKTEFLELAASMSAQVNSKDFIAVSSKLTAEHKFADAIDVLAAGLKAFPTDAKVKAVGDRIKEEATKAGDSEALKSLKGLGYLG